MSILGILRTGVRIADKVTKSAQADVMYEKEMGNDPFGTKLYAAAVPMKAIVDWKQKQLRMEDGTLSVSRASVLFLDIDELISATAGEGIDDDDRITLPDGTTGPIIDMAGFIDAGTKLPLATEVFLG